MLPHFNLKKPVPYLLPPIGAALHYVASFQSQETSAIPSSAYRCSSSLCCLISISRNHCHAFFPSIGAALNYVAWFQSQETSVTPSSRLSVQLFTMLPHFNLKKPVPYLLPPIGAALHYVASFQSQETSAIPSSRLSVQLFTMLPHFNLKKPVPYLLPPIGAALHYVASFQSQETSAIPSSRLLVQLCHYVASFQSQETSVIPSSRLSVQLLTMLPHFNLKKPVPYLLPPIGAALHYVASFQSQETSAIPSSAYRCSSSLCCLISISRNQCHTFFPSIGAALHYVASFQFQETSATPSSRLSMQLFTMLPHFNLQKPVPYLLPPIGAALHYVASFQFQETSATPSSRLSMQLFTMLPHFNLKKPVPYLLPPIGAALHYVASFQSPETSAIPSSRLSVQLFTMLPHFNLKKPVPYLLPPIGAALHYVASFQSQETSAIPSSAYRCSSLLCCLISISRNQCHTFFPSIGAALHYVASFQFQETSATPSSRLSMQLFTMLPHFNLQKPVPYLLPPIGAALHYVASFQFQETSATCCLLPVYRCSSSLCCLISISRNQCHTFFRLSVQLFTMLPHFNLQKPVPYLLPVYRCSSSLCCLISISRNQCHTFFPPIGASLNYVASFQSQETSAIPSSRLSVHLFTMLPHFNLKKPVSYLLPAYRCSSSLCCLISISRNQCHTFFPPIGAALHYVAAFQSQETSVIPSSRLSVQLFTMLPHFNLKKPVSYLLPVYRCSSSQCCLISVSRNQCHTFFPPIGAALHCVASFQSQETSVIPSSRLLVQLFTMLPHFNLKKPVSYLLPAYRCSSSLCCLISISRNQCHTFFPPIGAALHCVASFQSQETSVILSSRLSVQLFTVLPHFNLKKPVSYLLPAYRCSSSLCCLISISRNLCHTFFPPIGAALHYVASFQSQETSVIPSSRLSVQLFTMLPHFNLKKPVSYLLPAYRCSSSLCCLISISRNQCHTFFPPIGAALHYVAAFQSQETSVIPSSRLSVQLFTMLPHFSLKKPVSYLLPAYRCSSSLCCLISISRNQCHTFFPPIGAALHYVASYQSQETSVIPSSRLLVQLFIMLPHFNLKKPVSYLLPVYWCSSSLCCLISISRNQCHTFFPSIGAALHYVASFQSQETTAIPSSRLSVKLFTMLPHFNLKKPVSYLLPVYRCSSSLCCLISISRNQCHTFFPSIGEALHYVASFQSQETSVIPSSRLSVKLFTMLPHFNLKKPVSYLLPVYRWSSSLCCLISISRNQCHTFFPPIGEALHYVASFQSQETSVIPSSRLSVKLFTMLPHFNLKKPLPYLLPAYRWSSSLSCLISISRNQCHTFFPPIGAALYYVASFQSQETSVIPSSRLSVQLFTMLPHFTQLHKWITGYNNSGQDLLFGIERIYFTQAGWLLHTKDEIVVK